MRRPTLRGELFLISLITHCERGGNTMTILETILYWLAAVAVVGVLWVLFAAGIAGADTTCLTSCYPSGCITYCY